jgi:methionyl-tRNA formyltransferase
MGTPELARSILTRIATHPNFTVVAVVAQPDRPVGRHLQLTPPPVKAEALIRGIPVLQPLRARDPAFIDSLQTLAPDVIVVAAYGQILPREILDIPTHRCLNVHTSLLPRWRGAAPIQWAIAEGDQETGVCLMQMEPGLDTGPVIASIKTPIHDDDDAQILHDRLAILGGTLVVNNLSDWIAGRLAAIPQPIHGVTHARKITREDGRIDWSLPSHVLWRRLRAFKPWPGSFCTAEIAGASIVLKVHAALPGPDEAVEAIPGQVLHADRHGLLVACGAGTLRVTEVQPEGGRRQPVSTFLAGHRISTLS